MNRIAFDVENDKRFSSRIQKIFRRYQISSILKKCNAYKEQGFPIIQLIQYLFCLVFRNRSMFLDMQSEKAPDFRKDTVYRLKNAAHIHWLRFTTLLSARIISDTISPLTSDKRRMENRTKWLFLTDSIISYFGDFSTFFNRFFRKCIIYIAKYGLFMIN